MKSCLFLLLLFVLASCNSNDSTSKDTSKTNSDTTPPKQDNEETPGLSGCYLRVLKRDTLALTIQQSGKTVTGKLSFDNFEKDGSRGPVTGTIENNILKLIYSYQSEGMHSVMEVYFKIEDSALVHGVGEVGVKSDTAYYANPNEISYPATNKLAKIDCEQLPQKFK